MNSVSHAPCWREMLWQSLKLSAHGAEAAVQSPHAFRQFVFMNERLILHWPLRAHASHI